MIFCIFSQTATVCQHQMFVTASNLKVNTFAGKERSHLHAWRQACSQTFS